MENNSKNKFLLIGLIVAAVVGFFLWFRTNTKKLARMAEYSVASVKVHKVGVLETEIKVSVLIKNPSDIAVKLDNYKVDVMQTADQSKKTLATSVVTSLTIPANSSVVNDIIFKLSNLQIGSLLLNAIQTGLEAQFKGKLSFFKAK